MKFRGVGTVTILREILDQELKELVVQTKIVLIFVRK